MVNRTTSFNLVGGLDLVTPQIKMAPGKMSAGQNYEPSSEGPGYARIEGYERFNGLPSPSGQTYWILNFTVGVMVPTLGRVVSGATSGAVGTVVVIVLTSGSWVGNDAAGYLVIREHTGTFVAAENITVSQPIAFSSGFSSGFN
jgi:hypothetical protein